MGVATGNPLVGALAPFGRLVFAKAFGNSVDEMLRRELALLTEEEKRRKFIADLDALLATAMGQALVQLIQSQHHVKQELLDELGGVRQEFAAFREDLGARLSAEGRPALELAEQIVENGALGVRLRPETMNRAVIHIQRVSGPGTVGIEL